MTIQVRSNEKPVAEAPKTEVSVASGQESSNAKLSAPEAKATEQKESEDSEATEHEAVETSDKGESHESDHEEETHESDKEETSVAEKKPKTSGFQKRINKLNAKITEAAREAEYWKREALKGATDSKTEPKVDSEKKTEAVGKPKPDDFDTHTDYVEALTDWKLDQKEKAKSEADKKSRIAQEQSERIKSYLDKKEKFAKDHPDFDEVVLEVDDIPLSAALQEILLSSENGPQIAYELAKNRKEYERVCKLPPLAAAREIGKLETRISAASSDDKEEQSKKLTKAPSPISLVGAGKGSAKKSIFDPDLSQAEYERLRREQLKRKGA